MRKETRQEIEKIEGRVCPRWKTLPNHDCSECPDANQGCIMISPFRATDYINAIGE